MQVLEPVSTDAVSKFGLHNMRGSDEGMKMIVANTIKGLSEEGNTRLAVNCLVSAGHRESLTPTYSKYPTF